MKKQSKLLALLLSICLLFSALILPSGSVESGAVSENSETNLQSNIESEITEQFVLPDIIDPAEAEGYIGRIKSEETGLETLVFENIDGSRTMKIYGHPVKYVDADGKVKDISTDLVAVSGGYRTKDNNIITTFPQNISDGITLEYAEDDIGISMIPVFPTSADQIATLGTAALAANVITIGGK